MLMSPDSSINSTNTLNIVQPTSTSKPIQTVIRVQVQECSQSQQPSSYYLNSSGSIIQQHNQQQVVQQHHQLLQQQQAQSSNIFYNNKNINNRMVNDQNTIIKSPIMNTMHQPQQQQPHRPETPEYTKAFPVMDTTVASSVKGEPDLNIGKLLNGFSLPFG